MYLPPPNPVIFKATEQVAYDVSCILRRAHAEVLVKASKRHPGTFLYYRTHDLHTGKRLKHDKATSVWGADFQISVAGAPWPSVKVLIAEAYAQRIKTHAVETMRERAKQARLMREAITAKQYQKRRAALGYLDIPTVQDLYEATITLC